MYGSRILVYAATVAGAADAIEAREIDRDVLLGQTEPQAVFETMGRKERVHRCADRSSGPISPKGSLPTEHDDGTRRSAPSPLRSIRSERRTVDDFHQTHRCLMKTPPGEDWDGSWRLEQRSRAGRESGRLGSVQLHGVPPRHVRYSPQSRHSSARVARPLSAMCGRLPIGKGFF